MYGIKSVAPSAACIPHASSPDWHPSVQEGSIHIYWRYQRWYLSFNRVNVAPFYSLRANADTEQKPNEQQEISHFCLISQDFLTISSNISCFHLQKYKNLASDAISLIFYYLCTNYFRNETKNSITLHHVATFDVSITRSGKSTTTREDNTEETTKVSSLLMPNASLQMAMASTTSTSPRMVTGISRSSTPYIYNRWGQKLYEWTDPATGWDGTYRGKPVKEVSTSVSSRRRGRWRGV